MSLKGTWGLGEFQNIYCQKYLLAIIFKSNEPPDFGLYEQNAFLNTVRDRQRNL